MFWLLFILASLLGQGQRARTTPFWPLLIFQNVDGNENLLTMHRIPGIILSLKNIQLYVSAMGAGAHKI